MAKEALDSRLRKSCKETIAAEGGIDIYEEFEKVAAEIGLSAEDAGGKVTFYGADPIVESTVALGTGASIGLMLKSVAATKIWRMRGGEGQDLHIDIAKSISRLSALYRMLEMLNGYCPDNPDLMLGALMLFFRTKDGRFVIPDNNMPKLRDRMQELLKCNNNMPSVVKAILKWDSDKLEKAANDKGLVMGKIRSLEEFMQEPVYRDYLKHLPLIEIEKIGESDPEPLPMNPATPLEGVRALGMGHIIAGAGLGRALACHGADVLNIWRPNEFEYDATYLSADVGMRSSRVDYKKPAGNKQVKELLADADIFFANRRPKLMEEIGMTAKDCAKLRPGIIYCNTSFAGESGPWRDRPGYDQVAGAVTGMAVFEGTPEEPQLPCINVVNDFIVSWLAAAGVMEALARRAKEGGSYKVHVSLCRTSLWLMSMGIFDKRYVKRVAGTAGGHEDMMPELFVAQTPLGEYQGYTDQVQMSGLKEDYSTVLVPRGSGAPVWLKNGVAPEWHPEDPMANIQLLPVKEYQDMVYKAYRDLPKIVLKVLKLLP
ncbi:MAG: carnitine dehydratase [Clostridia bacterium]|nr:carnitine dehydratase [Clostridia bacterium]